MQTLRPSFPRCQIERQSEQLKKQIAATKERRDAAEGKLGALQAAREETEASFVQARGDGKRLRADVDNVEKAMFKANQEIQVRRAGRGGQRREYYTRIGVYFGIHCPRVCV